jgi:hypothetical protein
MNTKSPSSVDRDYLRRCKESTPEQRLDWLAAAVEFAFAPKKINRQEHSRAS